MIYIMSDIHGQYAMYQAMLDKLNIQETDTVYILGDVIDRGPDGIKILQDLMKRPNFELFIGNHEWFMLDACAGNGMFYTDWICENNGGKKTIQDYIHLPAAEQDAIINYLKTKTHVVKNLNINGHRYILSHAGMHLKGKDIDTKDVKDPCMSLFPLVWNEGKYWIKLLPGQEPVDGPVYLISGHVCTRRITGKDEGLFDDAGNGYIWVDIDCGCAYQDDKCRLACLTIDDEGVLQKDITYVVRKDVQPPVDVSSWRVYLHDTNKFKR